MVLANSDNQGLMYCALLTLKNVFCGIYNEHCVYFTKCRCMLRYIAFTEVDR